MHLCVHARRFALDGASPRCVRCGPFGNHLADFGLVRFLRRTPGPPPFSSINSTPAASKVRRTAESLAVVIDVFPSANSARRIVVTPRVDSRARSSALQRRRARPALIWALVSGFTFILTYFIPYDINHTEQSEYDRVGGQQQTPFSMVEEEMKPQVWTTSHENRRSFIGGSDALVIMGRNEAALIQLWREKRGEAEAEDLSGNLIVQLGAATEELNRPWYERNTSRRGTDVQRPVKHSALPWMAATLDGIVEGTEAVFEAKFMPPWSFSKEAAAEKYMAQLQHNMWVTHLMTSVLSIITGGGKWVEITIPMDPLYLSVLIS